MKKFMCTNHLIENTSKPNHVFKLTKALYGLKQAPWACYEKVKYILDQK